MAYTYADRPFIPSYENLITFDLACDNMTTERFCEVCHIPEHLADFLIDTFKEYEKNIEKHKDRNKKCVVDLCKRNLDNTAFMTELLVLQQNLNVAIAEETRYMNLELADLSRRKNIPILHVPVSALCDVISYVTQQHQQAQMAQIKELYEAGGLSQQLSDRQKELVEKYHETIKPLRRKLSALCTGTQLLGTEGVDYSETYDFMMKNLGIKPNEADSEKKEEN